MLKKIVGTALVVTLLLCMPVSVYAANKNITLKVEDVNTGTPDFTGYYCKYYYKDISGNKTSEATVPVGADGTVLIPVEDSYGLSYEIFNKNDTCIVDEIGMFYGNSKFWDTDTEYSVGVSTLNNEGSEVELSEQDKAQVNTINLDNFKEFTDVVRNKDKKPEETSESESVETQSKSFISAYCMSEYNVDLLLSRGVYLNVVGDGKTTELKITNMEKKNYSLPVADSFKFSVSDKNNRDWNSVKISKDSSGAVQVNVVPNCLLHIINGDKPVNVSILKKSYSAEEEAVFGVANGETYEVINLDNKESFSVTIPTNAKHCRLDLSKYRGIPVNEIADEDAVLDDKGEFDNPYNIPLTSEMGYERNSISDIVIVSVLVVIGLLVKLFKGRKVEDK